MKKSQRHFALQASARLIFTTIAAATFTTSVQAEQTLETMTVTANRMPSVNVLAPTTVITRADIDRLQITDLTTLLARQPGIDVSVSGGLGKTSSIFMRGTNSDHLLVLVDGVKWHSATSGGPSIQDFPVEQIERIEIVRGPRSGLYGSEAIGGVIQVFTRKGQQGVSPYAKVAYGTHNSKQASAGVSGGDQYTTYNLSFNHQATDGINAKVGSNLDKDGYRNNSISAKLNHQLNDRLSVGLNISRSEGDSEFDGYFVKGNSVQQIIGANVDAEISENWALGVQLAESRDQSKNFTSGPTTSVYNTRHRFATISNTLRLSEQQRLNIGLDYDLDDIDSSKPYDKTSRDNKAVFISWQGSVDKHSWLLSGRHDDNEAFGSYNTGTAEWGYWLQDQLQLTINAGTAFKAPTFNDLYWPGAGDPTLVPEESTFYGIGIKRSSSIFDWSLSSYHNSIDNLIAGWPPENINQAKIKGVDIELSTTLAAWDIAFNASLLKPEDEQTGNILPRRAKRLANLHVDKTWGKFSAGASWKLSGHRFDDTDNDTRLGGYGLLDLRAAYQLDADWSVQANMANVFDKSYQTADGYNSLDRTVMVTLSYKP